MRKEDVTMVNLPTAVDDALTQCKAGLTEIAVDVPESRLRSDLELGLRALELIKSELVGAQRPREKRSAAFTRYVIDEGSTMRMTSELRDLIVQIESVYERLGRKR